MNNRLVIPSCSGLLDCFNIRQTTYSSPSICCLQGDGATLMVLALFSFIYQNFFPSSTCTYTFKTSSYKKFIGYTEGGKSKNIITELETLPSFGYLWNDDTSKQLLSVSFNDTKTLVTVESKYFQAIFQHMKMYSGTYNKWGRKTRTGSSTYSSLVYTSLLKERNVAAVETTIELVKLIERRETFGARPNSSPLYSFSGGTVSRPLQTSNDYKRKQGSQQDFENNDFKEYGTAEDTYRYLRCV